ncbi:MAG TPA: hypothetical protein VF585_07185 [Chthoniobacterales bacterium]|jgi:hypothetical protein
MNSTNPSHNEFEELDLAVPNLNTPEDEANAGKILKKLRGVEGVRIIERGIWVSFRPDVIHHEAICDALQAGGYDAIVFQDSETGETGSTNV